MTVILVRKRSAWEQYIGTAGRFGDVPNAESLKRMKDSHDRHTTTFDFIVEALYKLGIKPWVLEGAETLFKATPGDTVLTVGGDGTFLSASHSIGPDVGIMGINSDPKLSRGRFCNVLYPTNATEVLKKVVVWKRRREYLVPRMQVSIDGRVVARRILNEALYSATCPAAMTRVAHGKDRYACSGLWIGTAAGSTGAIKSAGGKVFPLRSPLLQTIVREPCEHKFTGHIVLCKKRFDFVSKTADSTLYFDGPFLRVPVGFDQRMTFEPSDEPLAMVGPIPS
jgi:NAD+ kinase